MQPLKVFEVNGGRVEQDAQRYRLCIPPTTDRVYADAQLDDYAHPTQTFAAQFANTAPQHLKLRARFSHARMRGTAGFGFWNHPFGQRGEVLAPPCNVWFMHSSPESNLQTKRGFVGHGFKAAMLDSSGAIPSSVMQQSWITRLANRIGEIVLRAPAIAKIAMRTAQTLVRASEAQLSLDMSEWHSYEIHWQRNAAEFFVDGACVLCAPHAPDLALGFVAWVDNYFAIAADGAYKFGYVACEHEQWMEIKFD